MSTKLQLKNSYGGVVLNEQGQLLLRRSGRVTNGEMWTFAKGHPRQGETPEECAIREVFEETGVEVSVIQRIPGSYVGTTTRSIYFLMNAQRETGVYDDETTGVQWVSILEAEALISKSPYKAGRQRDLVVLRTAGSLMKRIGRIRE